MTVDTATFLVALYTIVDDLYKAKIAPRRTEHRGRPPDVSDSEILTLVLLAQWLHLKERALLRYVKENGRCYFPRVLDQGDFNRRARYLAGVLVALTSEVSLHLGAYLAPYQVFDLLPLPLMRRCRGDYHRLFDSIDADVGKGGSDHDWFYGCQMLVAVTPEGVITGFLLGPASTENHWLADAFLCWRDDPYEEPWGPEDPPPNHHKKGTFKGPKGPLWPPEAVGDHSAVPYIADGGFQGHAWRKHWFLDYGGIVITPDSYEGEGTRDAKRQHSRWRQIIETVNDSLEETFRLAFPGAKTLRGLLARVAAKVLAHNLGIWLNHLFGRPDLALATLFSC